MESLNVPKAVDPPRDASGKDPSHSGKLDLRTVLSCRLGLATRNCMTCKSVARMQVVSRCSGRRTLQVRASVLALRKSTTIYDIHARTKMMSLRFSDSLTVVELVARVHNW
jgi:hypothetical protein